MQLRNVFLSGLIILSCEACKQGSTRDGSVNNTPTGKASTGEPQSGDSPSNYPQGTITSSGGYLFEYETNPWFLENTTDVSYCIDADEDNFGVSSDVARGAIRDVLQLWKHELQRQDYFTFGREHLTPFNSVRLGTQNFREVSCTDLAVNLRFQLGRLSSDQMARVGNPRRYIGGAFQTSYDEEAMRGSGFIYIAPEKGPLRPEGVDLHDNYWSLPGSIALKTILMHELGHVFGVEHRPDTFMAEEFPQSIIEKDKLEWTGDFFDDRLGDEIHKLFDVVDHKSVLFIETRFLTFIFGANPANAYVLEHELDPKQPDEAGTFSMYEVDQIRGINVQKGRKVGEVVVDNYMIDRLVAESIKLPPTQKIFTLSKSLRSELLGSITPKLPTLIRRGFHANGTYRSMDGAINVPVAISSEHGREMPLKVEFGIFDKILNLGMSYSPTLGHWPVRN